MKYLFVTRKITDSIEKAMQEFPLRSGCYNWINVMDGELRPYYEVEDFNDYDVVQCNMAPSDWAMIMEIRKKIKNSSTKLVLNNDHVAEIWDEWGLDPLLYKQVQECGDVVFGTEPYQTSHMIDKAITIPHPTDTRYLRLFKNSNPENAIGTLYHWWQGQATTPAILNMKLRDKYKLRIKLFAYWGDKAQSNPCAKWSRVIYDKIYKPMGFKDYMVQLMDNKFIYEPCCYHTYGRTTVETACIGVPTIGTDRVFSMRKCFPNMICDPYDLKTTQEIAEKVLKGGEWLEEQKKIAKEGAEYFNYKNSKQRMMEALDGC